MTFRGLALTVALLAVPAVVMADTAPLTEGLVWSRFPSDKAIGPYTPEIAYEKNQPGWAVVDCAVDGKGALADCEVVKESAKRLFFGEAAKRMIKVGLFTLAPQTASGQPTAGARVRFPVVFRFEGLPQRSPRLRSMPPVEG